LIHRGIVAKAASVGGDLGVQKTIEGALTRRYRGLFNVACLHWNRKLLVLRVAPFEAVLFDTTVRAAMRPPVEASFNNE
jgi:hypothetical protein